MDNEIEKTARFYGFKPHFPYRISPMVENRALSGQAVTFVEMVRVFRGDIVRAKVRLLDSDEEWLINPHCIINL